MLPALAAALFAGSATPALTQDTPPVSASAHAAVEAAAKALGGSDRLHAIRNITLFGYGNYAYQFGGGNVTPSIHAVQRYEAANDLRRVFDFEHDRYQQFERRNMSFTFALEALTSNLPVNQILDGDIAYDIAPDGTASRIRRFVQSPWQLDGVHMRRMWMLNDPVALIRAALDPGATLSGLRTENTADGPVEVIDLRLPEGDRLAFALSARTHLPYWVRWTAPHANFGELTFTTYLQGYVPVSGLMLPLSYQTMIDWRSIDYFDVHVNGYEVDGKIPDLAAPTAVRASPEPADTLQPLKATHVAKGVWYISAADEGVPMFEFDDHLVLFDLNRKHYARAIIEFAKTLAPGKAPTQLITSHQHLDHLDGIRVAVAEGLTIISRRENEQIIREMVTHPATEYPDELAEHPRPLNFIPVDEHLRLADHSMTLDVYWARDNSHMGEGLFAYDPDAKVMAEADIATAAHDYQWWPDNYMDNLDYYRLQVDTLLPVHFPPMKQAQVIQFIKEGVQSARERCAAELAKGNYLTGCPVLSHRY
jgi:glyoxylase-like metal-dependent hydrolase (beta-lactamase superfamily II)